MGRLITIMITLLVSLPASAGLFPDRYDPLFRAASAQYLPAVDWRLLKAQCYQESRLRPDARSPVGAMGLCQFMPATWSDAVDALRMPSAASAYTPDLSIQAGAWYMGRMRSFWSSKRPEVDRHSLALASYNGGAGNLLKAQKACGGPALYADIVACLPSITGPRNAAETLHYVPVIWGYYRQLVYGVPS